MNSALDSIGLRLRTDKASSGHNYLFHYEAALRGLKDESFNLLEIGGLNGASLNMWAEYFPNARIVCADINPNVKQYETDRIAVMIGNSASLPFLDDIKSTHSSFRVVIDDGSHRWDHQRIALHALFGAVEPGGFYIAEDIHTSYEPGFAGGDDIPFTDILKRMVDYLNTRGERRREIERMISPSLLAIARQVDWIQFIPRSCIIKKKTA